jgi:predicted acetyltransferase
MNLKLIEPTLDLCKEFKSMVLEYKNYGENLYYKMYRPALNDFKSYVINLKNQEEGIGSPSGWCKQSTFWVIDNENNKILGVIRIRKSKCPEIELPIEGNIGYDISPLNRKKGYGKIILSLGLEKARNFELNRVMVNCAADNIRSMKIIENNGGIFYNEIINEFLSERIKQYFIYL